MPIKHHFQSGRGDNDDAGAIQPSAWDAPHDLTGTLAALDAVAPTPNVFFSFDGGNNIQLVPKSTIATIFSPVFTGVPLVPTPSATDNSFQIANTAFVQTAITNLIGGAPGALDTLNELATAINDDASYAATTTAALGVRLRVDAAQGLNSTQQTQGLSNLGVTIGVAANNVVKLDGSAKLPALDGSQLTGVLPIGAILYASSQGLTDAQRLQAIANLGVAPECGRLRVVSSTALSFLPTRNGDLTKIAGSIYRIPATGIVGLANTNVFVNGVSGQNLAPNTLYYVYEFTNSGVLTADFSTTAHSMDTTAGNVGTEIKTGNSSRSLIGMVYTNGSSQFSSNLVASWFNRRSRTIATPVNGSGTPGAYFQEIGGGSSLNSPGARVYFLVWGDENEVGITTTANVQVTGSPMNIGLQNGCDGAALGGSTQEYVSVDNNYNLGVTTATTLSEGLHFAVAYGGNNAGTCTYTQYQTTVSGVRG